MSAIILHLSDIHITNSDDPILKQVDSIAATLFRYLPAASHIIIAISGDIVFSGKAEQFSLAVDMLVDLKSRIENEKRIPISFVIAPGNHDCDFDKDSAARKVLVKQLQNTIDCEIDRSIIEQVTSVQKDFFDFRAMLEEDDEYYDDGLWYSKSIDVEGSKIQFVCLNLSWFSKIRETPNELHFPIHLYEEDELKSCDLRVMVFHHPAHWLNQGVYRNFRRFVRRVGDIVLSGHEHEGNYGIIEELESDQSVFLEGYVLQSSEGLGASGFQIVELDLEGKRFMCTAYRWDGRRYCQIDSQLWSDYRPFPEKSTEDLDITRSFEERIQDPGAYFRHPNIERIYLPDIFVFPDLKKAKSEKEDKREVISAKRLLDANFTTDGAILEGEEKAGRTSLLFQVFLSYRRKGFVPVYLQGRDLKHTDAREIENLLKRVVREQYGPESHALFEQTPISKKIALIDDFDRCPIRKADSRDKLLHELKERFSRLFVTVDELFEVTELLDEESRSELKSLDHFRIQHFGYLLRHELINKWYSLGRDIGINEAMHIAICDDAERKIDSVISKTIIPSLPIYLLTLLQSFAIGRGGNFKEGGLGYYYQFLLSEALQGVGVKPDQLTELFQYCSELAWEFHSRDSIELSDEQMEDFNERFSKEWHSVELKPRLRILERARILRREGDGYVFRYPYVYYYFKGQYLSRELNKEEIRDYVVRCCQHLYVRDYANTVLFLAHHTNDDFLLRQIASSLGGLFSEGQVITFEGDTKGLEKLISEAPALVYSGEPPEEHRRRQRQWQDEVDEGDDGLVDTEEETTPLSLLAQMTMLFKTTEILGEVLKNQYAKIRRERKNELISELFCGPLRALGRFYSYFQKYPDSLIEDILSIIEQKGSVSDPEKRDKIARRVAAQLIEMISYGFVMRAADSANAKSLREDVRNVVRSNPTVAFKLIELGMILDSPQALPRQKIKDLVKQIGEDPLVWRLLKMMVINRLYMFKTTEGDMRWLRDKLKLNIDRQHEITYQEHGHRMLSDSR